MAHSLRSLAVEGKKGENFVNTDRTGTIRGGGPVKMQKLICGYRAVSVCMVSALGMDTEMYLRANGGYQSVTGRTLKAYCR
jgi:hypothetical protein